MKNQMILDFEASQYQGRQELPAFRPGDTIQVDYEIQEGTTEKGKVRVQSFAGVVIRYKKGTADGTFTVRKIGANGVGVERVFPIYSPKIKAVKVTARGRVRRSRLFYLRERSGKAARIRSKFVAPAKKS